MLDPDSDVDRDPGFISKKDRSYRFSDVFDETYSNESVYKAIYPIPPKVLTGINCTIFAYGMTGAGKSHTMFGVPDEDPGLNFRLVEDLITNLKKLDSFCLKVSYLEIYNEQIRDLLIPNSPNLLIFEDPVRGFLVSELTDYEVSSVNELRKYVNLGNSRRTMASTAANQFSSRSHAILQIFLEIPQKNLSKTQSKLNLIDLAGSERASATDNRGLRMKEGANINRSLLTLGLCINILSDTNKKGSFVPYRDSKLTKLLKDSLGGNTLTFMVACISPWAGSYDETINTLKYASKAKNITKKVNRNVVEVEMNLAQYKKVVEDLQKEIKTLRGELEKKSNSNTKHGSSSAFASSQERLFEEIGEKIFQNLQENWELSQSLNELNELQAQNEERLKACLEKKTSGEGVDLVALEHEVKGLRLIMENNEKVKKDLEFSILTNHAEKKSLQEYLRNLNNLKEESHLSLDFLKDDGENPGNNSMRMREMEREMELMRRKLAEKDLLIEKNNELLKILKKNHEHSVNFSPQFYPLPHHVAGNKAGGGSLSFGPVITPIPCKKSISNFNNEKKKLQINPIKLIDSKSSNDPLQIFNQKLSDRTHKKTPLIPNRLDTTGNDTSIMRGCNTSMEKKEDYLHENHHENINENNENKQEKQHQIIEKKQENSGNLANKSINLDSPQKPQRYKINISSENIQLRGKKDKEKEKEKESPIRKKPSEQSNNNCNINTNITNSNNSNNGLIINVIHIKGPDPSLQNPEKPIRKKSNKEIQIKPDNRPSTNTHKGNTSATNKYFRNINMNISYDNSQTQKPSSSSNNNIPIMKANLTTTSAKPSPKTVNIQPNTALINKTSNNLNISNNNLNRTYLSNSSMLKKDLKININIKNLDRARENYRAFKEKLNKISQNLSPENLNDSFKKNINEILTDYSQNQYMLSANDQEMIKKMQELINFPKNRPIIVARNQLYEEKTRSNSFNFCDARILKEEFLVKHDTKNEDEILTVLNNKKFGRLNNERMNSEHQRNTMFYQGSNAFLSIFYKYYLFFFYNFF